MTREELIIGHILRNLHKIEDQYRGWIEYIAEKRGVETSTPQIIRTDKGEDLIIELYSEDKEALRKTLKSISKYKRTINYQIEQKQLPIEFTIKKEKIEKGLRIIISFIMPKELIEIRDMYLAEIQRQREIEEEKRKFYEELLRKMQDDLY